jgi:glycosyltransferase involved in cell wall biosynthesis
MTLAGATTQLPGRIAIDVGAARTPPTGVGVYLVELASALAAVEPERFVRIGIRPDGPFGAEDLSEGETNLRERHYLTWLLRRADSEARSAGCGLVHYTNGLAPLRPRLPFVLTIQDLSLIRSPGAHPRGRLAAVPFLAAAARTARLVIVPSEATRQELRRLLHVADDRIVTIPLAARTSREMPSGRVLEELGIAEGGYILAIGTIEPRKNHRRLLAAFEKLATAGLDLRLVILGRWGWRSDAFRRELEASPVRDRVFLAGHRPDPEMATLLAHSAVLAYPSTYEGFGLPVVEAMAAGIPVVTSRASALPETAGGAAVLVDPLDVGSIADGLVEALARRDELAAAGRARVAGRTWVDVAEETIEVYRRAADQPPYG